MSERDRSAREGTVEEALPRGLFRVSLDEGGAIRAGISSAARRVTIKVLPGDRVLVEVSSYDPSRGRIVRKLG
ncbi:MAG: translation initiation factor IF-1 [Myxococcota bacterium]